MSTFKELASQMKTPGTAAGTGNGKGHSFHELAATMTPPKEESTRQAPAAVSRQGVGSDTARMGTNAALMAAAMKLQQDTAFERSQGGGAAGGMARSALTDAGLKGLRAAARAMNAPSVAEAAQMVEDADAEKNRLRGLLSNSYSGARVGGPTTTREQREQWQADLRTAEETLRQRRRLYRELSGAEQAEQAQKAAQAEYERLSRLDIGQAEQALEAVRRQSAQSFDADKMTRAAVTPGGLIGYLEATRGENNAVQEKISALEADIEGAKRIRTGWDYQANTLAPDFVQNSRYRAGAVDDSEYNYINRDPAAIQAKQAQMFAGNGIVLDIPNQYVEQMSDEQVALFNYLYHTKGRDEAYQYIKFLEPELNAAQRQKETAEWQAQAEKDPKGMSALSVVMAPTKGISYAGQAIDYLTDGKIDQNAAYNRYSYLSSGVRKTVSELAEDRWGKKGSFLYQTGMSMGDFLMTTLVSGGFSNPGSQAAQKLALSIMGTGAAADTTIAAKDRGLSDGQAFAIGTVAGAAEVITEKVSLDKLLDMTTLGKNKMGYFLQNVLAEGSEEVGSDLINLFGDVLIAKDKSEWQQSIDQYKAQGMDEKTAFWHAAADQAEQMGLDFLGGALSGGIMSGGGIVGSRFVNGTDNFENRNNSNVRPRITMEEFANSNAAVWRNIEYSDTETQRTIMQDTHQEMVKQGRIVQIPDSTMEQVSEYYPDLRTMKKAERTATLRQKVNELKVSLRTALSGLKNTSFEFDVNGKVLEAKLYDTGVREVIKKITQNKASMLYHSAEVFKNAQYLYSMPDYDADTNIYRWNYFYTPVQIGEDVVGVRIAVRDIVNPGESQIYNWGIKKDATLDGGGDGTNRKPTGVSSATSMDTTLDGEGRGQNRISSSVSSEVSNNSIPQSTQKSKGIISDEARAAFGAEGQRVVDTVVEHAMNRGLTRWEAYAGFSRAYQWGLTKGKMGTIPGMSKQAMQIAYNAGKADAGTSTKTYRTDKTNAPVYKKEDSGVVSGGNLVSAKLRDSVDKLAKRLGTRVMFRTDLDSDINGEYNLDTGVISLNANKGEAELRRYVIGHEFVHRIQQLAPEAYNEFRSIAARERGYLVRATMELYQEKGRALTYEQALDEVTADYGGELMDGGETLDRFITEHKNERTLLEKLRDVIRTILDTLTGREKTNAELAMKKLQAAIDAAAAEVEQRRTDGTTPTAKQKETATAGGWIRYSLEKYDPETASIKEQLENSREILNGMEIVASATVPTNLKKKDIASKWVSERLKSTGYRVDRQGYGEIYFSPKDIDRGLRYADTPAEKAALAVLPQVLKRGIEIGDHNQHKNRTKQTITFAAPVSLNGIRGNMAVVINRHGNNYYAHRIVLPDGTAFQFSAEKTDTAQELSRGVTENGSLAKTTSAASIDSIPDSATESNIKNSLFAEDHTLGTMKPLVEVDGTIIEEDENTATAGGNVRYSLNPEFSAELDAWDGRSKHTFRVGTTSEILQSIGIQDKGIIWHGGKIAEIMKKHPGMTREVIKQVPGVLENPIIVLKSRQSGTRLAIFGEVYDEQGAPVTAILELQPTTKGGELLDMNVIASAYGKDTNPADFVSKSDVLYIDPNKNRTQSWMQGVGLQLPSDATALGPIGTVTYQDGNVKIEGVPFEQYMQGGNKISNIKNSFAGVYARTANRQALAQAEAMEREGWSNEKIRQSTGWFRGMDGKWRFEIDDSRMEYKGSWASDQEIGSWGTLEDYIQHDELFEAYPELRNVKLQWKRLNDGDWGYYEDETNTITLDVSLRYVPESTLLHEIQHVIQKVEGFTKGTNLYYLGQMDLSGSKQTAYQLYKNAAGELEAEDVAKRMFWNSQKRGEVSPRLADEDTIFAEDYTLEKLKPLAGKGGTTPTAEQKETATAGGNVRYSLSSEEKSSIKEQIRRYQDELNAMDPVGSVETTKIKGLTTKQVRDYIVNELKKTGYRIDRKNFGIIQFEENEINNSLNYKEKDGAAEDARRIAFLLIPKVLKRGKMIFDKNNHKNRGYGTITFAAPVIIDNQRGNMAVVVKETKGNRYKVHRLLTPEGEIFPDKKRADAGRSTADRVTEFAQDSGGTASTNTSASINSILDSEENSNHKNSLAGVKEAAETLTERYAEIDGEQTIESGSGIEYTADERRTNFMREFSGFVYADKRVRMSKAETERVRSALKSGSCFITDDGSGIVRTAQREYWFDVIDGDVVIQEAIKHDVLNIHKRETSEEYEFHDDKRTGGDATERGSGLRIRGSDIGDGQGQRRQGYADRLDGEASQRDPTGDLPEGTATGATDIGGTGRGGSYSLAGVREAAETLTERYAEIDRMDVTEAERETLRQEAVRDALAGAVERYGEIPAGEHPARAVHLPRKTGERENVSQTVRTVLEAKATPETMVPNLERLVAEGEFSYESYGDEAAIRDAEETISGPNGLGWDGAQRKWFDDVRSGAVSKEITALGWTLYNNAANSGNTQLALDILQSMANHQRSAAQALQASRILKTLSPEAQLYSAQRSVANLQEELKKKYKAKAPELKIDEALAAEVLRAETQADRDAAMEALFRDIGHQMPSRFIDKWNAWRYLAMLGNARTHVRNIVGNAGFVPVVAVKNTIATGLEATVDKVTKGKAFSGERGTRTKSLTAGTALYQAAFADYDQVAGQVMGSGKYQDFSQNKAIEEGRVIFKSKPLEWARRKNGAALEVEDSWFAKPHYAAALASYCKANGITAEQVKRGKGMDKAREYAIREAQKATYRDTNAFSQMVSELGRYSGDNPAKKTMSKLLEGVLPFRKTPANILARGLEYSPARFLKSLTFDLYQVRKGNMTTAEMLDGLSAGLTGSGILCLGFLMAGMGLARGAGVGDDDKEKAFDKLTGHQDYALELPDGTSVTLDWLAPEALPFFVGVNLHEQLSAKNNGGRLNMADWMKAIGNVSEPMLEMSCLQSLNDLFDSVGYATQDGSALSSVIASAALSYLTQGLPTLLGQAERSGEGRRMTTYTEENNWLTKEVQYALGKASARVPGVDFDQIPYIDAWGREELSDKPAVRVVNHFLNPAYLSKIDESAMEQELLRLYEQTGDATVFPQRAGKKITVNGAAISLSGAEYVKYATERGQMAYGLVAKLTESKAYQAMGDEDRAACVGMAYDYADAYAKTKVSDYEPTGRIKRAIDAVQAGDVSPVEYICAYQMQKDIESLKNADGETVLLSEGLLKMEAVYNIPGLTDAQRQALFRAFDVPQSVRHYNRAAVEEKLQRIR